MKGLHLTITILMTITSSSAYIDAVGYVKVDNKPVKLYQLGQDHVVHPKGVDMLKIKKATRPGYVKQDD